MKITRNALKDHNKELLDQIITYGVNSIDFGSPAVGPQNVKGFWFTVVSPVVANTEFTVNHNLGYIPSGLHVIANDQDVSVKVSRKAQWTAKQIFLKINASSANLTGFII
jgi:hypothetical protein